MVEVKKEATKEEEVLEDLKVDQEQSRVEISKKENKGPLNP